jgi:hypothetical protein
MGRHALKRKIVSGLGPDIHKSDGCMIGRQSGAHKVWTRGASKSVPGVDVTITFLAL